MTKYNIYCRFANGMTKEFHFDVKHKAEAIECYKEMKKKTVWCKFISVDSDDDEITYDLSDRY